LLRGGAACRDEGWQEQQYRRPSSNRRSASPAGFDGTTTPAGAGRRRERTLLFKHFPTSALYRAILSRRSGTPSALPLDDALARLPDEDFFRQDRLHIMRRVDADDAFCRRMIRSALTATTCPPVPPARVGRLLTVMQSA
jgi:hypothetical protein